MRALVALVTLAAVQLGCAHASARDTQPPASVAQAPASVALASPVATPRTAPVAVVPSVAAATVVAATAQPSVAVAEPKAAAVATPVGPQILSVVASPTVIRAGQTVSWDVRTTHDIVTVAANVSAYHLPLQRFGPGHFVLNFTVPANVPGIFHGTYDLDVHGETAAGASADRRVSLEFR